MSYILEKTLQNNILLSLYELYVIILGYKNKRGANDMENDNVIFLEYSVYSLENLLREYILNPQNESIKRELIQIIKSANEFQNGRFEKNNYIAPSVAYSLIQNAVSLTNMDLSIDKVAEKFSNRIFEVELKLFITNLLKVISSTLSTENRTSDQLISWI